MIYCILLERMNLKQYGGEVFVFCHFLQKKKLYKKLVSSWPVGLLFMWF